MAKRATELVRKGRGLETRVRNETQEREKGGRERESRLKVRRAARRAENLRVPVQSRW